MFLPSKTHPPISYGVSSEEYHAIDADIPRGEASKTMSRSELAEFAPCPRKWKYGATKKATGSMEWGSLIDCLVLTPDRFAKDYSIHPDHYPSGKGEDAKPWNLNANFCRAFHDKEAGAGRRVISSGELEQARIAANRLHEDKRISEILGCSKRQVLVRVDWHDEETGVVVPFKCLVDIVPDPKSEYGDTLCDLKTARSAKYEDWVRAIFKDRLHFQSAVYIDAFNAASGLNYESFGHLISENEYPFEPVYMPMGDEFIKLGRLCYQYDMRDYCKAIKTGFFRGYQSKITEPEPWMMTLTP